MKRDGRKIVAVVVYDCQMAKIADRAGVEIVCVGDCIGVTLWGHQSESELTIDQMLLACQAVSRGVERAMVSCDVPLSVLHHGSDTTLDAARRLVNDGGAGLVKVDASVSSVDAVRAIADSGISVWAQLSGTTATNPAAILRLVRDAQELEAAGA